MPKFRKRPVVIEAMQVPPPFRADNVAEHGALVGWLGMQANGRDWVVANEHGEIDIQTLEGVMRASNGDWIIRGIEGEIYPCKNNIFEKTYELVSD